MHTYLFASLKRCVHPDKGRTRFVKQRKNPKGYCNVGTTDDWPYGDQTLFGAMACVGAPQASYLRELACMFRQKASEVKQVSKEIKVRPNTN